MMTKIPKLKNKLSTLLCWWCENSPLCSYQHILSCRVICWPIAVLGSFLVLEVQDSSSCLEKVYKSSWLSVLQIYEALYLMRNEGSPFYTIYIVNQFQSGNLFKITVFRNFRLFLPWCSVFNLCILKLFSCRCDFSNRGWNVFSPVL